MKNTDLILRIILFMLLLSLSGCTAPRENPLDPQSDNYQIPPEPDNICEFDDFRIITIYQMANPPIVQKHFVRILVRAADPDGLDSVKIEIADTLLFSLQYADSIDTYILDFNPSELDSVDINPQVIYKYENAGFYALAYDKRGFVARSHRAFITRILSGGLTGMIAEYDSVQMNESYEETLTLKWDTHIALYDTYYAVKISSMDHTIFYSKSGIVSDISKEKQEHVVSETLLAGEYIWQITAYDDFENMIIGPTRSFTIR